MPIQNYSGDTYISLIKNLFKITGATLPQAEIDTLQRQVDEERAQHEKIKAWVRVVDGKIGMSSLDLPFMPIYSEIVPADVAAIEIKIPSAYKHLVIICSGKSTSASPDIILLRINDDSGSNYSFQDIQAASTTLIGAQGLTKTAAGLGDFIDTSDDTLGASSFTIIPHYQSTYYKTLMTITNFRNASFRYAIIRNSFWNNTDPISKLKFFTNANIKAGSIFSIYGIK